MIPTLKLPDGTVVPRIGQGTWYLGEKPARRAAEIEALRTGIEAGLTLIDTAEMYGGGLSEELVGQAIATYDREKLFLVSKVFPHNAGRRHIFAACENSLRRMDTDYLDMYLLHWRGSIPLAETVECMEELVAQGKIRRWGVSNLDLEDMQELWHVPGGDCCQTDQVLYHLGSRGIETVLLPWLQDHNVSMMAYCPLAQGGSLRSSLLRSMAVRDIADKYNCTLFQVLLAFVLSTEGTLPIPRTGSAAHTLENAAAAQIKLTAEDLAALNAAFPAPKRREWLDIV